MHVILNIVASHIHRYLKYWYAEFSTYAERFHNLILLCMSVSPYNVLMGSVHMGMSYPKALRYGYLL